jgi:hypothetical protein
MLKRTLMLENQENLGQTKTLGFINSNNYRSDIANILELLARGA